MKTDWSGNTMEETSGDNVQSLAINGKRETRVVAGEENGRVKDTFRFRHATALLYIEWDVCAELHLGLAKFGLECSSRQE